MQDLGIAIFRWAIAHKFLLIVLFQRLNIEIKLAELELTPVAKIKPVNIGGVTVSNATLHNEDEILERYKNWYTATIERAGDVIPHITSVDLKEARNQKFIFPLKCPSWGLKL